MAAATSVLDTPLVTDRAVRAIRGDLGRTRVALANLIDFGRRSRGWRDMVREAEDRLAHLLEDAEPPAGGTYTLGGYLPGVDPSEDESPATGTYTLAGYLDFRDLRDEPAFPGIRMVEAATALAFVAGALGAVAADVSPLTGDDRCHALAATVRGAATPVPAMAAGLVQALITDGEQAASARCYLLRECLRLTGGAAHAAARLANALTSAGVGHRADLGRG